MALKINGTPVYIGEEYEVVLKKMKKALGVTEFREEVIEYVKDKEKNLKMVTAEGITNAYFNINNRLVSIVTNRKTFTGYCGARGQVTFDFKDEHSHLEELPIIFNKCKRDTKVSYCGKMGCWFETDTISAVYTKREKNTPE